jgi:chemotaxis protein MotA
MSSLPIGILITGLAVFFAIRADDYTLYFNAHALIIVFGGTLGITFLATPRSTLRNILISFRDIFDKEEALSHYWQELQQASENRSSPSKSKNPLINYAIMLWQSGVSKEMFIALLSQKKTEIENSRADAIQALRNLAKYPPAMGMTGTVIALVSLFTGLGVEDRLGLGKALGLAMTATFFGLILSNAFITPFADRLHVMYLAKQNLYEDIYQLLILVNRDEAIELKYEKQLEKIA